MLRSAGQHPVKASRNRFQTSVGQERWLVSYSDFVTLLFAFFVVMYSVSQVSESKYRTLSETLGAAFSNHTAVVDPADEGADLALAKLDELQSLLEEQLSGFPIDGQLQRSANENWIELSLSSELLFESGSAEPSQDANQLFAELAASLIGFNNEIQLVGHTDDVPINNKQYADNWALSSARAVAIVNILSTQGIAPQRMSATGFGEHRPIADNTTLEGRKKNRRVVIRVSADAANNNLAGDDAEGEAALAKAVDSPDPNNPGPEEPAQLDFDDIQKQADIDTKANSKPTSSIAPVRLEGGDLLFSSSPELPRNRRIEQIQDAEN